MRELQRIIARVAPTDLCVLIQGESGVGKELVARAVHEGSRRRNGPLLPLNCGAMAPHLAESELFGHERGSFTGAVHSHQGHFERSAGGTLFLDEVTEMPLELQVKLLRVLETREVRAVGGTRSRSVDVRVLAATNRDPQQAVAQGALREDLYYRLAVFPITVPPLRKRQGDIERLARHFLARLNARHGTSKVWSVAALEALETHGFPGNVRELTNLVSRAFVMSDAILEPGAVADVLPPSSSSTQGGSIELEVGTTIADGERHLIEATLRECQGDKPRAARILGISLKTLYNRLNLYAAQQSGAR